MDFIVKESIKQFSNPGVVSRQLLNPLNAPDAKTTITEVHLTKGASQPRHIHKTSEQIWYATKGRSRLLLAGGNEKDFAEGDVVRFAEGDVHGLQNDSAGEFVYISITTPPINFSYAYNNKN